MWVHGTALVVGMIAISAGCAEGRIWSGESAERQTAAILSQQRDIPRDFAPAGGDERLRGVWPPDTGPPYLTRLLALAGPRGLRDLDRALPADPPPGQRRPSPRPGSPVTIPAGPGLIKPAPKPRPSPVPLPIVTGTTWSPAPSTGIR